MEVDKDSGAISLSPSLNTNVPIHATMEVSVSGKEGTRAWLKERVNENVDNGRELERMNRYRYGQANRMNKNTDKVKRRG